MAPKHRPNPYRLTDDGHAEVLVRSKVNGDHRFLVDAEDLPTVLAQRWCVARVDLKRLGPVYYVTSGAGFLHRVLLDAPEDRVVDHINNDPLDNRRSNLRVVTQRENCNNRRRER